MSGKIYNKNLTFLKDQPFAENLLTTFYHNKRRAKLSSTRDSSFPTQSLTSESLSSVCANPLPSVRVSFGSTGVRNKSERMKKAETSLVKHFCLLLERTDSLYTCKSEQYLSYPSGFKVGNVIPHLLVSIDSMQNILLSTRGSRPPERIRTPSQFKKILRECRKIRLLYGNLSMRHLSRATSKMRLPGENLLIWLESRLDVVLERSGFFGSVKAARQCVLKGQILVNSKIVKSPSFILKGGDLIKVVQKRLLVDFLGEHLSREAILSNEVFPSVLRNKSIATAVSKNLLKANSTSYLKPSIASSAGYNKIADKVFDSSCLTVQGFFPYKSFYTWLLKKKEKNFQSSEYSERENKALLSTELQFKKLPVQNPVYLDKKAFLSKNWRFVGSPHLLFSLFFLYANLKRAMFFLAQTCNKNASIDKKIIKHKAYETQKRNNTSTISSQVTRCCFNSCSIVATRDYLDLLTIPSVSKYCAVTILTQNTESRLNKDNKKSCKSKLCKSLIDTFNIELFLNIIQQPFHYDNGFFVNKKNRVFTSQNNIVTAFHNFLSENIVRVLTEVYTNIFTLPSFTSSVQDERFSRDQGLLQSVNSVVIKNQEKGLLCVLFSDLLLYSLLIKKELVCVHLNKELLETSNRIVSRANPASVPFSKNRKTCDYQVSPSTEPPIGSSRVLNDNSRSSKVNYKKFTLSNTFDSSQARRIKPIHLEVSFQSLCVVYLFPPQRICLPVMVDVDCLAKAF